MESFRVWEIPTIILLLLLLLCVFTMDSINCQGTAILHNPIYVLTKATSIKIKFELYDTRYDATTGLACARICRIRRSWTPGCLTFNFHAGNKTCDLYSIGDSSFPDPNQRVYLLEKRNKFFTVSIGQNLYSVNFVSVRMNYFDARAYCRSQGQGGKLLEFDTLEKYDVMRAIDGRGGYRKKRNCWIGANDRDVEGHWVTEEDGLPLNDVTWLWKDGGKNGGRGKNCARLRMELFELADMHCGEQKKFLCERDVVL